ncbi:MAG: glycosyltransferase family 9 protein [Candidatus Andersenbacteria bacterium]
MKRFLLKHVGNMGDLTFFIPPVLATLKRHYPDCHITLITAWGFKDRRGRWGKRNQDGFCLNLMMTNPHLDQLVHWHDTKLSLAAKICEEEGQRFPTWNKEYFTQQKEAGGYDGVYELDFGLKITDNPIQKMYEKVGLPQETYTDYKLYFTPRDREVAEHVTRKLPQPRIVLLEGLESTTTRGWDPGKITGLEQVIKQVYGVRPLWFGARHVPYFEGRPLTLRENIATLTLCDVAIGVLSGPLHFAAAAGTPTLTLYCDHSLQRAAPAYFLNHYMPAAAPRHQTLLGPDNPIMKTLKNDTPALNLTPQEAQTQGTQDWLRPGRQSTKTCLAVITIEEIMTVLGDILPHPEDTGHF